MSEISDGSAMVGLVATEPLPASGVCMGILRADGATGFVAAATEVAQALADVIRRQGLYSVIQGKNHVKVEGWTTLAAMLGVTPHEVTVVEAPEGVFTATVELRRLIDGMVVGRASAECGSPEETDRGGKPLWANRPRNARRSMALTRATGKACRMAFSWIMTLAGYEPTPDEEMYDRAPPSKQEAPQNGQPGAITAAQADALQELLESIETRHGKVALDAAWNWLDTVSKKRLENLRELPAEAFAEVERVLKRKAAQEPAKNGGAS